MGENNILTKEGILDAVRRLNVADRIDIYTTLGEELADDLPDGEEESDVSDEFSEEQLVEFERRWAEHQKDPSKAIPWEEVERDAIQKYGSGQ